MYPVQEPDLLQAIEARLREKERTGELARLQREGIARAGASLREPKPVPGLQRTVAPRVVHVDPSLNVARDFLAPDGTTLVRAGRGQPARLRRSSRAGSSSSTLATWPRSRHAARLIDQYQGRVKPILVGGSFVDLMRRWERPVYYDQGGVLVRRLGIRQVPALVSQDGRRLRVEELAL